MSFLKKHSHTSGAVLALALAFGAAAQTDATVDQVTSQIQQFEKGRQLRVQGRYTEARAVFAALLKGAGQDRPDNRYEAVVLDNIGINEHQSGHYADSETAFNRAVSILRGGAANDPIFNSVKTHLAELYVAENRPAEAEVLLRQVSDELRSSRVTDGASLSLAYDDLAVACMMQRKHDEAETLLRQAASLIEGQLGSDSPILAENLLGYAGLLIAEHRYTESVVPAEHAWQILRATSLPVSDLYRAGASSVLSAAYYHVGRLIEAEFRAREAVDLAQTASGSENPQLGLYLANYATVLRHENHKEQAKEIQKRADAILARSDTPGGYTVNVLAMR